jgi:hypothetical protein
MAAPRVGQSDEVTTRQFYLTCAAVFLLLLVFFVLPPTPRLDNREPALDQSWQVGLVDQFLRHAQCGVDLVFTYGPWGFLGEPRGNPAIYPWLFFGRLVLALGVSFGAAYLSLLRIRRTEWRFCWLAWFLALATPWLAAPFLLYAVVFETDAAARLPLVRKLTLAFLVAASALGAHVKLVGLPLVGALGIVILADELAAHRVPWISGGLAVGYAVFYFAAFQHVSSFVPYLRGALATMSGYSAGMSFEGPLAQLVVGALFCLLAPLAYLLSSRGRRGWVRLAGAAWTAAYFFMAFKQAFVRQDGGHIWAGLLMFAVPGALVVTLFVSKTWVRILLPFAASSTIFFAWTTHDSGDVRKFLAARWHAVRDFRRTFDSRASLEAEWRGDLERWSKNYPIAQRTGTVDIMPIDILTLIAESVDYRPRPVFQSYAAVNEYLARLNADYLSGPQAPDVILQNAGSIDSRYASTEDNLSWPVLFARYQPAGFDGEYLALRKAGDFAPVHMDEFLHRTLAWDEEVAVEPEPGYAIWAQIDVKTQPFGRLIDFVLRPPDVNLVVQAGGTGTLYTLIPALGRSGFLLSPVVEGPADFALLYRGRESHPLAPDVTRFAIRSDSGRQFYQPQIDVRLYHLALPTRPVPEMLTDDKFQLAESLLSTDVVIEHDQRPKWMVTAGGLRLQANAPAVGSLPFDGTGASLDVAFGITNQCYDDDVPSSRIEFRVSFRDRAGAVDRMLLRRTLEAKGEQNVNAAETLQLPKGVPGSLQFATTALEGNCRLGAYWSRVKLH